MESDDAAVPKEAVRDAQATRIHKPRELEREGGVVTAHLDYTSG